MPSSLETPVLQVDANVIHKVDTSNPENLYSMWTVFARCADSVAQGRRLENLSWRLWNRETFCCEKDDSIVAPTATTLPRDIQQPCQTLFADDVPQLSGSVESVADEEAVEFTSDSAPVDIVRPRIRRQDSCASSRSRGKERHISSDYLEKMVVSIIEAKVPLTAPLPSIPSPLSLPVSDKLATPPGLERSGSTTTESPCKTSETPSMESLQPASSVDETASPSRTKVIRGFSPSQFPMSRILLEAHKKPSPSAIPGPDEAPAPKIVHPKKQPAKFALGGSGSGSSGSSGSDGDVGDDGETSYDGKGKTVEARKQTLEPKRKIFQMGASSEDDGSLRSALHHRKLAAQLTAQKKTASFNAQPVTKTYQTVRSDESQFETDDSIIEESAIEESAIEDDEDEWEDSVEESGRSSLDKISFHHVDSAAHLPSRRSLITLALAASERNQHLNANGSRSTSAVARTRSSLNGPSMVVSPNDSDDSPLMMKQQPSRAPPMRSINEVSRSGAQPIMTPAHGHHQVASSPRSTRRNMLATELTESLRRHLLWERSQKSQVANAVLKRRHTSQDVANLKQYPDKPFMKKNNDEKKNNMVNASSWDQYFDKNSFTGYHASGW